MMSWQNDWIPAFAGMTHDLYEFFSYQEFREGEVLAQSQFSVIGYQFYDLDFLLNPKTDN